MIPSQLRPNKKIPSFCFESPWLKPFNLDLNSVEVTLEVIDAEAELTRLLTEEINRRVIEELRDNNTLAQDLVAIQPMDAPQGNLFYFDYNYGPMEEPIVYDDGSWSMDNIFEGVIGIKSEIKQHTLI